MIAALLARLMPWRIVALAALLSLLVLAIVIERAQLLGARADTATCAAGRATDIANAERAARGTEQSYRAEETRRTTAQREANDEITRIASIDRARRASDGAGLAAAGSGVQRNTSALAAAAASGVPSDPAALGRCQASAAALAELLAAHGEFLQRLAGDADEATDDARTRGLRCAAEYDALTPPSR